MKFGNKTKFGTKLKREGSKRVEEMCACCGELAAPGQERETFRAALAAEGGSEAYWVWDHLGDVLRMQGKPDEAAQAYRTALAHAPSASAFEASVRQKLSELSK